MHLNPNKAFPRLTVRGKLTIAFLLLAGVPLVLVGVVGGVLALGELRRFAGETLQYDLRLAETQTARGMEEIARHAEFLGSVASTGIADVNDFGPFQDLARDYLVRDSSALIRLLVLDANGFVMTAVHRPGEGPILADPTGQYSALYHFDASQLGPQDGASFRNVELRQSGSDSLRVMPVLTAIRPIFDPDGLRIGAVVGEARAEELFAHLEDASPTLAGVTGLLDAQGYFLYHSEWKRNWGQLLSPPPRSLDSQFGEEVASEILSSTDPVLLLAPGSRAVAVRPLLLEGLSQGPMTLFRVVPLRSLDARVADILRLFVGLGVLLAAVVTVLAMVASEQITAPVYALREAAHLIAGGDRPEPVIVETNDEFEDLAEDFNMMSDALHRHRSEMEALVESRTAELRQAEAWLGELVRSSADAIVGLDQSHRITLWNRGAHDLFGYRPAEVQGAQLSDLIGAGSAREARFIEEALARSGAIVGFSTRRRTKDGLSIPVSLTQTAVQRPGDEVIGYSVIFRDERPRELLEQQMRSSERLAAVSVMAAGLAHELNNPLSVIGNRIELMQRDAARNGSDPRLRRDIEVLGTQVERIGHITGDLLRFAREDGDDSSEVDVREVTERVLRLLRRLFVAEGIELEGDVARDLPPMIGNDSVLETVLVNLLLNARQATPPGGSVTLECRSGPGGEIAVEVRDTGPGVPRELRRQIFEPFFTTRADRGGTGLGLAVCRALVDRMGATLEVDDAPGGGARFVLTLPHDPAIIQ